jgi:hypothetical protein
MIGFISILLQILLITLKYSAIADLHNFQFTVSHALGLFVFTSHLLATDLNTETSISTHYEVIISTYATFSSSTFTYQMPSLHIQACYCTYKTASTKKLITTRLARNMHTST